VDKMSAGLIVLIVVLGTAVVVAAARWWWCRRNPAALRGDWWPDFEREFLRWAAARPPREHRPRHTRPDTR
jgi:hypothetical protein